MTGRNTKGRRSIRKSHVRDHMDTILELRGKKYYTKVQLPLLPLLFSLSKQVFGENMFPKMDHPCFEHCQTCFMEPKNTDLSYNKARTYYNPAQTSNNHQTLPSRIQSIPYSANLDKDLILDQKLSPRQIAISTHFASSHRTIGNERFDC